LVLAGAAAVLITPLFEKERRGVRIFERKDRRWNFSPHPTSPQRGEGFLFAFLVDITAARV
jgi:hypothetical protein